MFTLFIKVLFAKLEPLRNTRIAMQSLSHSLSYFLSSLLLGTEINFRKADSRSAHGYGVPYDYNSVMHYSEYAFSRNSQKTIEPKVSDKYILF